MNSDILELSERICRETAGLSFTKQRIDRTAKLIAEYIDRSENKELCEISKLMDEWKRADHIRLHTGEMSAQEMRTAKAVVNGISVGVNEIKDGR